MGRKKLEGISYVYECGSCQNKVKRNENNFNDKPCPKCGAEKAFTLFQDQPEQKEEAKAEKRAGKTALSTWQSFKEERPEIGDLVLYKDSNDKIILHKWNEENLNHGGEYETMGALWAKVFKP